MNHILDTNVLMFANGNKSEQASLECIRECAKLLLSIREGKNGVVIIDTNQTRRVIREYLKNIDPSENLAGSVFLLELLKNPNLRIEVPITPIDKIDPELYAEYPDDPRLAKFDPSDKKWIALARAYMQSYPDQPTPPIAQASDIKWREFESVFGEYGIIILWVCG